MMTSCGELTLHRTWACTVIPLFMFFDDKCLFFYYLSSILSPSIRASSQLIMWMLKRGRGIIDTVFKINQFFPSRLTQYQNQCVSECVHTTIGFKVLSVNQFYQFFFSYFTQRANVKYS